MLRVGTHYPTLRVAYDLMTHILMLLSNAFRPDPRVAREAAALLALGYRVTILCWDRKSEFPERDTFEGADIIRVKNIVTIYGAGARQLLYTPRFWGEAIRIGRTLHPDAIHCHDLDTLYAGIQLKKHFGCPLVYDAHEDYPALMTLYLPRFMIPWLSWLESRLLKQVDATITASSVFADKLRARGIESVTTIGNYQSLEPYDAVTDAEVAAERARLGLKPDDFVAAYIGGFTRNRQLLPLIEAARQLPDVQVLLWGDGHQKDAIQAAVATVANARYLGWLPAAQVPLCTRLADIIFYCLRPDYPGAIYNAPNTLSNAMAAARPIIANDVGDLGRIVAQSGCGLLLPEVTPEAICQAISALRDPAARKKLGQAGRAAAETTYNWAAAGQSLREIYEKLIRPD